MCPKLQTLSLRSNYIVRPWQTETSLTEDSLNHIQKLGKCLHTLQLLTYWSFSYIALAQTLVDLPQLRKCAILCPDRCLYFLEHDMVSDFTMALEQRGKSVSLCFSVGISTCDSLPNLSILESRTLDILIHSRIHIKAAVILNRATCAARCMA
ncbi:hypothetical protein ACOMHN_048371 [Nucella lapillus]